MYVRAYTHVAGWHTSEGDFTSLLSVVVDRDGSRLEHRGDKDFPWHLGAADVQAQLDGIVRNQAIYEKIATEMRDSGWIALPH